MTLTAFEKAPSRPRREGFQTRGLDPWPYRAPPGEAARDLTRSERLDASVSAVFGCLGFRGSRLPLRFFLPMTHPLHGSADPRRGQSDATGSKVFEEKVRPRRLSPAAVLTLARARAPVDQGG